MVSPSHILECTLLPNKRDKMNIEMLFEDLEKTMNEEMKHVYKDSASSIPSLSLIDNEKLTKRTPATEVSEDELSLPRFVRTGERKEETKEQIVDLVPSNLRQWDSETYGGDEDEVLEVDLSNNPTTLCRLITHQYYERAIDRVNRRPAEARTWLVSGNYRFLPLHMACDSLERVKDDPENEQLVNDLITLLVVTYPYGCYAPDPLQRLPIHQALWHGADAESISILLMGYPEALHTRDHEDRNLMEITEEAGGKHMTSIKELLCLDLEFWKKSAMEAKLRMKRANIAWAGNEVESIDPLAASQVDLESVFTSISNQRELARQSNMLNTNKVFETFPARKVRDVDSYSYKSGSDQTGLSVAESIFEKESALEPETYKEKCVQQTPWTHLEARAAAAEFALYSLKDNTVEIDHKLNEIQWTNREIGEKLDHLNKEDLVAEVEGLRRDNKLLDDRLARMEAMLMQLAGQNYEVPSSPVGAPVTPISTKSGVAASANKDGSDKKKSPSPRRRKPKYYEHESQRVIRHVFKDKDMVKQLSEIFNDGVIAPSSSGGTSPMKKGTEVCSVTSRMSDSHHGGIPNVVLTDSPRGLDDDDDEAMEVLEDFMIDDIPKKLPLFQRCLPRLFRHKNQASFPSESDRKLKEMETTMKPQVQDETENDIGDDNIVDKLSTLSLPLDV